MATAQPPMADAKPHPYTFTLPDSRTVFVEVPAKMVRRDRRSGAIGFSAEGVKFLDRVRALAMEMRDPPSPGHIRALREALGLTQAGLGNNLGYNSLTVSRWERGEMVPGHKAVEKLRQLRRKVAARGVLVPEASGSRGVKPG